MEYTVKSGDTLGQIAKNAGLGLQELATANGIEDMNNIKVGQILNFGNSDIPENPAVEENQAVEEVEDESPSLFSDIKDFFSSDDDFGGADFVPPEKPEAPKATFEEEGFIPPEKPEAPDRGAAETGWMDTIKNKMLTAPMRLVMSSYLGGAKGTDVRFDETDFSDSAKEALMRAAVRSISKRGKPVPGKPIEVLYDDYDVMENGMTAEELVGQGFKGGDKRKSIIGEGKSGLWTAVGMTFAEPVAEAALSVGRFLLHVDDDGNYYIKERFNFNHASKSSSDGYMAMRATLSNNERMPVTEDEGPEVFIKLGKFSDQNEQEPIQSEAGDPPA